MTHELFDAAPAQSIELIEDSSPNYGRRTGINAKGADVTLAVALDYQTHGEVLTNRIAGPRYIAVPFGTDVDDAVVSLCDFMESRDGKTVNVAGNGIYTFAEKGISQDEVNAYIHDVLRGVQLRRGIEHVRSGGQTGVDWAGLVAGIALGIPVTGLFPAGFKQRNARKQDFTKSRETVLRWLMLSVEKLRSRTGAT